MAWPSIALYMHKIITSRLTDKLLQEDGFDLLLESSTTQAYSPLLGG